MEVTPNLFITAKLRRKLLEVLSQPKSLDFNEVIILSREYMDKIFPSYYVSQFDCHPTPDRGLNVSFTMDNVSQYTKDLVNTVPEEQ